MFAVTALATLAITCQSAIWVCRAVIWHCTIRARPQLVAGFTGGSHHSPSCQPVGFAAMGNFSPLSELLLTVVCLWLKITCASCADWEVFQQYDLQHPE